ncbi:MAG: GNAT family N-acetyltransferase, partial [Ktedonobacterales bacterium]
AEEAFEDHWGHVPQPYDEWLQLLDRPDFDPSLWFMAMDGDQIAGAAQCRVRLDNGWIGRLSVRRPYRQRGVGTALLLHAFREFQRRGYHTVALGVDSQNLTGATRLYEQVGMRVTRQFDSYRKVLRPGADLTVHALLA